jgi:quinol monooxygenase YgiN
MTIKVSNFVNLNFNTMPKYLLHGSLLAKEGYQEELSQILVEASKLMQTAKGCELYTISLDPSDKQNVWITEIWSTKEDHDNSLSVDGVRELITKAMPLLANPPTKGQELEIVS